MLNEIVQSPKSHLFIFLFSSLHKWYPAFALHSVHLWSVVPVEFAQHEIQPFVWYCIIPQDNAFIFGYFVVAKPSLRYLAAHGYSTNTSSEIFEIDVRNCETWGSLSFWFRRIEWNFSSARGIDGWDRWIFLSIFSNIDWNIEIKLQHRENRLVCKGRSRWIIRDLMGYFLGMNY